VTEEKSGKPPRKLPERGDAIKVPVPFDDAIKAALETKPPPKKQVSTQKRRR
jgi:hypothetical protein